ncbi:MAG: 1,4-dihydroxy-2-naphthoate octaprenyltransferase [Vicingaceae bacterium]|jgi:1,4-dihydroxy-2-naphthoate octaprenyltransferase
MLDALKLMRIPFSIFLMPVFWFALIPLGDIPIAKSVFIFLLIHVLIYPASNGYNSFFDKDEGSIGGLKTPPKVNRYLFPMVIAFDVAAIVFAFLISIHFGWMCAVYIFVSKAYSWDKIRLKKFPILSTIVVTVFQGFFMFFTVQVGLGYYMTDSLNLFFAIASSMFLLGSYPLTQVYQHQEDMERGDRTLSLMLGIKGTFIFSSVAFLLGSVLLGYSFLQQDNVNDFYIFLILGGPILLYFSYWFALIIKNESEANFEHTMKMNIISSICLSAAFIIMRIF